MSKHWSYYCNLTGMGSQADLDRRKAERMKRRERGVSEEERSRNEQHRRRIEAKTEQLIAEQARTNAELFQQNELMQRMLLMMAEERKAKDGKASVKLEWQTRMTQQEKLDRDLLWIPLSMSAPVPLKTVEELFKIRVKHVHPDQNPGIGDEAFIELKAARDRMVMRASKK